TVEFSAWLRSLGAAIRAQFGSNLGQGVIFYNSSNGNFYDNNPYYKKDKFTKSIKWHSRLMETCTSKLRKQMKFLLLIPFLFTAQITNGQNFSNSKILFEKKLKYNVYIKFIATNN